MSTVLLYTSPARGHLYPIMDVALALRAAGHGVVVQTLADEADHLAAAGVEHRPIHAGIEALPLRDHEGPHPLAQMRISLACWLERAPLEVEDLRATCGEVQPDLLLVDANCWGASALAEAQGRKWAMFLPYCLPVPGPDVPAFGPGFAPPTGWLTRLRDRVVAAASDLAAAPVLRGLDVLRADLGVPPLGRMRAIFDRPDVLLYRTAEPFEYPRASWPAPVRAIGPGLWAPPGEVPDWLHALPHPRVLVSVSTELQEDGAIIETALAALAEEPGSILVTTAALDPARFTPPHDRTRIVRFLSHAEIIPHVDLVVTHGGMGTTQRALAAGKPLVVVPWGRDQSESARRVEICGAGCRVPRSRLTAARLRTAVREALTRQPAAERVARAFREAGGAERAVELLEGLLDEGRATGRVAGVGLG